MEVEDVVPAFKKAGPSTPLKYASLRMTIPV
jgi:hypothetical protein